MTKTEFIHRLNDYFKETANPYFMKKGRSIDYDGLCDNIIFTLEQNKRLTSYIKRYGMQIPAKILQEEMIK